MNSSFVNELKALSEKVNNALYSIDLLKTNGNLPDEKVIEAENYAETLRIQREEAQYAQHKQTQSANFAAFQTEKQAEVGVAGADALGKMGANGAGGINIGDGGSTGFNPAAMMAGMALGGAVGQNMAGMMNNMMSGMNPQNTGAVPPPVPTVQYHVVVNGQAAGPFDVATLTQMAASGQLTRTSLVWKAGMADWVKAETVEELKDVLGNVVPPVPPLTN